MLSCCTKYCRAYYKHKQRYTAVDRAVILTNVNDEFVVKFINNC